MHSKLLSSRATHLVALCLLFSAALPALAQDAMGPPPVIVINREFLKPGRGGTIHEKTEAGYLAAARAGKAPFHYLALTSMTGADRALFISGYASFADWEAESKLANKNPALGASLDHAMVADGDLLASTDESAWMHRPELSLNEVTLGGVRYMEIQQVTIKPGHMQQAEELIKMYAGGYKKVPGANWSTFQQVYGPNSNTFLFVSLLKSLSETDTEMGSSGKAFETAMGESALKKLQALHAEIVDTEMINLFRISPGMSLPLDEWVKAEPDFWKPKPAPKPAAKPAP